MNHIKSYTELNEAKEKLSTIELDVIYPNSRMLKRLLKKHKVKLEVLSKKDTYSVTKVKLTGRREDLIAVISSESGWDDPDLEKYIND